MEKLSRKQKAVMDKLFEGENENDILADNGVSRKLYSQWLRSDVWQLEFDERIKQYQRQAQIIIASYSPVAAAKLVQLTNCEKEQTARQACLDIIQMERIIEEFHSDSDGLGDFEITQKTAAELARVLAKDAREKRKSQH